MTLPTISSPPETDTRGDVGPPSAESRQAPSTRPKRKYTELVVAIVFALASIALMSVSMSDQRSINNHLASLGIHFPAAGSPQFSPTLFPTVQQYAGQLVDTGAKAEAYANGYLAPELFALTGGQTPFAVGQAAAASPSNAQLQGEAAAVFQASTTQGMLLTSWGFSRIATYMMFAGFAFAFGFIVLMTLALRDITMGRRSRSLSPGVGFRLA